MPETPLDVMFFQVRGLRCAIPLKVVRGVFPMCNVTPVPLLPAMVRGIAPLAGHILPILDLEPCFVPMADTPSELPSMRVIKDKLLLLEVAAEFGKEAFPLALALDRQMSVGTVDEHHSRPPPARPPILAATVLDKDGPALLLDLGRTMDYVRDATFTMNQR